MKKHHNIIIAGAGGIAEAVGLLLIEWSDVTPSLFIGNRTHDKAKKVAQWITAGATKPCSHSRLSSSRRRSYSRK